jgi:hypothetical protein
MEALINKSQALRIAHSLLTGEKVLDDYGFAARNEAAAVIGDILETDKVEQELMRVEEPVVKKEVRPKEDTRPLTIIDLERKILKNFKKPEEEKE